MSADTVVRARIDSETKERATAALEAMGLSVSDAIRLLMLRIADEQRLPFAVQVPNSLNTRVGPWRCTGAKCDAPGRDRGFFGPTKGLVPTRRIELRTCRLRIGCSTS